MTNNPSLTPPTTTMATERVVGMSPLFEAPYGLRPRVHILYQRVRETSMVPTYAKGQDLSNGVDLFADAARIIYPGETVIVPTGIKVSMPLGWGLFILPRSGVSLKTGLRITNAPGLIDHRYLDEIGIIIQNTGNREFEVCPGDRLAQAVAMETPLMVFTEADVFDVESRGGGFGSSGI